MTTRGPGLPKSMRNSRVPLAAIGLTIGIVILLGIVLFVEWPKAALVRSTTSLAKIQMTGIPQTVSRATIRIEGKEVPASDTNGQIIPEIKVPVSTPAFVSVYLVRPPWISWLVGKTGKVSEQVVTPAAKLLNPVSVGPATGPVSSYFSTPVSVVSISSNKGTKVLDLPSPTSKVDLTVLSGSAGSVDIAAVPQIWEALPHPSKLVYFRESTSAAVGFFDENLASLSPMSQVSLTLSKPVSQVFGTSMPTIKPVVNGALLPKGKWTKPTPYSLVYTPNSPAFWPSEKFTLTLPTPVLLTSSSAGGQLSSPTASVAITGAAPSITRLQQLLAQLNYLPLSWTPASGPSTPSLEAQANFALSAPNGTFSWRWNMPTPLTSLWQQGSYNVITKGAVMSFEQFNGLNSVGLANPLLWPTLIKDVLSNKVDPHRYSWIEVQKKLPQTLTLYENGAVVLTAATNTGIQGLNTTNGTFPIYLRFKQNYMSGTNPDGSTYHDLVYWINYFLGSEAVHGFQRAQYGYQQSLGCVELPVSTAATVYSQVHIGTLTTILPS